MIGPANWKCCITDEATVESLCSLRGVYLTPSSAANAHA
jgi:hypothetical protein